MTSGGSHSTPDAGSFFRPPDPMIQRSGDALSLRPALRDGAGTPGRVGGSCPDGHDGGARADPAGRGDSMGAPVPDRRADWPVRQPTAKPSGAHAQSRAAATRPLDCGFAVNMAQNMYKWAKLADAERGTSDALISILRIARPSADPSGKSSTAHTATSTTATAFSALTAICRCGSAASWRRMRALNC